MLTCTVHCTLVLFSVHLYCCTLYTRIMTPAHDQVKGRMLTKLFWITLGFVLKNNWKVPSSFFLLFPSQIIFVPYFLGKYFPCCWILDEMLFAASAWGHTLILAWWRTWGPSLPGAQEHVLIDWLQPLLLPFNLITSLWLAPGTPVILTGQHSPMLFNWMWSLWLCPGTLTQIYTI